MDGIALRDARLASSSTQVDAALKLGVTQAYLSMVERGTRPVSAELASRAAAVFEVPPTALPLGNYQPASRSELSFKQILGSLGYPGFAYLRGDVTLNPTELLMDTLDSEDLDSRVTEALPWLLLAYPKLDWDWLTKNSKLLDRQNRLAFVVSLAIQVAAQKKVVALKTGLESRLQKLERSRLAAEDTLCKDSMTKAERKWLKTHRSKVAKHWNLLTDLTAEQLDYAAL
jgi:transcriptional regulator with XRE-family HTH domain